MITEKQLFSFFRNQSTTLAEFLKTARVKTRADMIPLKTYMRDKDISMDTIRLLFENIQTRNEYLSRFYRVSLHYPPDISIVEPPMKNKHFNNDWLVKYKNVIRNLFFWEILKNTQSGMDNVPTFLDTLENLYKKYIIDYKLLTPSAIHYMKLGRLASVFSSYFFRASIMNPYLVYSLNHSLFQAKRVFTPTLGWGSYFYGLAESGITHYVGTDVIPVVCDKIRRFSKEKYPHIQTHILCSPSENLLKKKAFLNTYRGFFDLIFFSPPYYKLEIYEGTDQSTSKYPEYEDWLTNYWEKTMELCSLLLHPQGKLCYILSGYGSENTKGSYDLLKDMNAITRRYFRWKETQSMYNKNVHVTQHRDTSEKIMIFYRNR